MKRTRLGHLTVPLGLGTFLLVLYLLILSLLAYPNQVIASTQTDIFSPSNRENVTLRPDKPSIRSDRYLFQASDVPSISNITGATYNEARGEVVIFGIADPSLPPLDISYIQENLVVALRAFYAPSPIEDPGVSIEGTEDPLQVLYFGNITDTHFGQVAFETDRLLKTYTMGFDNLTEITVTSAVTGYMSFPNRMKLLTETVTDSVVARYFYTPTVIIKQVTNPPTLIFSQTQKLIDWAYLSSTTSTATTAAAQGFVDNFNQYYRSYAAERLAEHDDSTLYEMVQLSKLTAIAQWIQEEGLEFKLPGVNAPWLSHYPVTYQPTVTQTTGITVTWVQTISGDTYDSSLRGGTYAAPHKIVAPTIAGDIAEAADHYQELSEIVEIEPESIIELESDTIKGMGETYFLGQTQGPLVAYIIPLADSAVSKGNFEDGPNSPPWVQIGPDEIIRDDSPYEGSYGVIMPVRHNTESAIWQALYIPADATMARLTYWRAVATTETSHPFDFFTSFLADTNGNPLVVFETLSDADADGFWRQVSFDIDVSAYAGQLVQLWFRATTNGSNITNFFVDEVTLDYLDSEHPTVTNIDHKPKNVLLSGATEFTITFHEQMKISRVPTITIKLQGYSTSYSLVPLTGISYTNGYLKNDPTQWHGVYTFSSQTTPGVYKLSVSSAQDLAGNVMYPANNIYAFTTDPISPQIHSTFPISNANNVPLEASIIITFSEAMSSSTFIYTVQPNPGGWGQTWNPANKVVTLDHTNFSPNTTYTVTVTQAKDLVGNSLNGRPVTFSFTTAAGDLVQPQVKKVSPANKTGNVPVTASLIITFSETISKPTFVYTVQPNPEGWGKSWNVSNKVVTLTHKAFDFNTTYTVTVNQARDLAGNTLNNKPVIWSFKTIANTISPTPTRTVYLPIVIKSNN